MSFSVVPFGAGHFSYISRNVGKDRLSLPTFRDGEPSMGEETDQKAHAIARMG
jgi:hypothetical protein